MIDVYSKAGEKVFEYFGNEILQRLPEKLQFFLLKSSILEFMEPQLLDNMLKINNSAEMLDSLARLNLFISTIPGEKNMFKYHPLFREFLLTRLHKTFDEESIKELHRKAATYFMQTSTPENAVQHWLASADWKKAGELIEKIAEDMINKGRLAIVNNWANSLPQKLVSNHPWLLAYKGKILYRWGELDEALQVLMKAKELFSKKNDNLGLCYALYIIGAIILFRGTPDKALKLEKRALQLVPRNEYLLKAEILNVIRGALQRCGKYEEAIKNLNEALSLCKRVRDLHLQALLLHNLGGIYYYQGDFSRAEQCYKDVLEIYSKSLPPWAGTTYGNMAAISLEKGDWAQCKRWLEESTQVCKDFNDQRGLIQTYTIIGEMLGETQEYEQALEKYHEALKLNLRLKEGRKQVDCLEGIAKIYMRQGNFYHAEQYINKALKAAKESGETLLFAQVILTKAEIEITTGTLEEAEKALLDSLSIIEKSIANYDLMHVYFWFSILYLKKAIPQEEQKLRHYINQALSLASKHEYDHFLIKNCRNDFSLLDFAVRYKIEHRYAIFILSQIVPTARLSSPKTSRDAFDTLTSLFEIKDESIQKYVIEGLVNIGFNLSSARLSSPKSTDGDERVLTWLEKLKKEEYPLLKEDISEAITKLQKVKRLSREVSLELEKEIEVKYKFENIVGNHSKMQDLYSILEKVIDTDVTILITGETGTGKELIARTIYYNGKRKDKKFIALACGALPETLLESELFGYVKGAFTGAVSTKKGLFEEADGGTLFLDDVTNLTPGIQAKLLRVLEDKEIRPVGGVSSKKVDVRIIASTNKDLEKEVKEGRFRDDLYYRLTGIAIKLPPLRERKSDIPLLVQHFLKKYSIALGKELKGFEKEAMDLLLSYNWLGNVRELEHEIERAVVLCYDNIIRAANLSIATPVASSMGEPMKEEQRMILNAIAKADGNKTKAAELIGWSRWKLYRRMKTLNIPC